MPALHLHLIRTMLGAAFLAAPLAAMAQDLDQNLDQVLDDETKAVIKLFTTAFGEQCFLEDEDYFIDNPPPRWALTWDVEWTDAPQSVTLYQLFCFAGAYNINHVYYTVSEDDFEGIQPVLFAQPEFEVIYEGDDLEAAVLEIRVEGMVAEAMLTNSEFDPESGRLTSHALWRGIGDASSGGAWDFSEGRFVLKTFDVDASYDGEINPIRLVDFTEASAKVP